MREFHGIVEKRRSNKGVRPNCVTTQLSLSPSIIVRSKSKTTTTLDIPREEEGKKEDWFGNLEDCCRPRGCLARGSWVGCEFRGGKFDLTG